MTELLFIKIANRKTLKTLISSNFEVGPESKTANTGCRIRGKNDWAKAKAVLWKTVAAVLLMAVSLFFVRDLQGAVLSAILIMYSSRKYSDYRKMAKKEIFNRQLGEGLMIAANAMRAGASLAQALSQMVVESNSPLKDELQKVDGAIKLGMTPAEAINMIKNDIDSQELKLLAVATDILSKTGGNMAEAYENIANIITDRINFRHAVRAATTHSRMTAATVSILPFVMIFFINKANPGYFAPLQQKYGVVPFITCFGMIGIGWFVIKRLLNVHVN